MHNQNTFEPSPLAEHEETFQGRRACVEYPTPVFDAAAVVDVRTLFGCSTNANMLEDAVGP